MELSLQLLAFTAAAMLLGALGFWWLSSSLKPVPVVASSPRQQFKLLRLAVPRSTSAVVEVDRSDRLGSGGSGVVVRGWRVSKGGSRTPVAVKTLPFGATAAELDQFREESKALMTLVWNAFQPRRADGVTKIPNQVANCFSAAWKRIESDFIGSQQYFAAAEEAERRVVLGLALVAVLVELEAAVLRAVELDVAAARPVSGHEGRVVEEQHLAAVELAPLHGIATDRPGRGSPPSSVLL